MRPKETETTGSGDLFRAQLDRIIDLKHELVGLADAIDGAWIDGELAESFSVEGPAATETRFMVGLLLLKHIHRLSDEGGCARWVENPYFQYFTGEEFFRHAFPHERSGLTHWRNRIGDHLIQRDDNKGGSALRFKVKYWPTVSGVTRIPKFSKPGTGFPMTRRAIIVISVAQM